MKKQLRRLMILLPLFVLLSASISLAHKVDLFISVKGDTVYTESYYPDGNKVTGGTIEVFDSADKKLLEGATDNNGMFSFKIPKMDDDLKIVLDAKMGHKTSNFIFKEELTAGIEKKKSEHTHGEEEGHSHEEEHEHAHQDEAPAPTVRKEPFPVASVLGGLGFIFGLTALVMQLTKKKD